ncbi:MAG: ribosome small subunit-dependent GTPase A [Octadecabacter sp.]
MTELTLTSLGWTPFFEHQRDTADIGTPARVTAVHRASVTVLGTDGTATLLPPEQAGNYAVGDWLLHDGTVVTRLLSRQTEVSRRAAGEVAMRQLIAANVDTLAVVTSCNADFNVARLERYLAMAGAAGCMPLIVLTKTDETDDAKSYIDRAQKLSSLASVIAIDARDPEDATRLYPWCRNGQTLALVGSSGVGKTTLQNLLTGIQEATQGMREDDAKGRHTTTSRALRATLAGGWLIDTPGMRELRLADAAEGIEVVFGDLSEIATQCKFRDCAHESEPGCAVQAAIAAGTIDPDRLARWQKLVREDEHNSESVADARLRQKKFGKMVKGAMSKKHGGRGT